MKSLLKMTWMEAKLFLREPVGAFFTLVFPLMMLFLFGSIYGNTPTPLFNGRGTIDISVPAYTAMIIATTGLMGMTITLSAYRENGVLRRLRTTPVSPLIVLAAQVIVLYVMTTLGMLMLIIAGKLVYNLRFEGNAVQRAGWLYVGQPELLCYRIHPGRADAHGAHRAGGGDGYSLPDVISLRRRLPERIAARSHQNRLHLPAADLRGQPAARVVDRRALERVHQRGDRAGRHPGGGRAGFGQDVSLGMSRQVGGRGNPS